jgi:hypothetical protein
LPSIVPFAVNEYLMQMSVSKWEKLCLDLFETIEDNLKALVNKLSYLYFHRFQSSGLAFAAKYYSLLPSISYIISTESLKSLEFAANKTRELISSYCQMECRGPFTQNDHYFLSKKEKFLENYSKRRRLDEAQAYKPTSSAHPKTNSERGKKEQGKQPISSASSKRRAPETPETHISKRRRNMSSPLSEYPPDEDEDVEDDQLEGDEDDQPEGSQDDKDEDCDNNRPVPPRPHDALVFTPNSDSIAKLPLTANAELLDDNQLLSMLASRGFYLKSVDELQRLHKPDEYEVELRVVAEVLAYFKVAHKRMIDVIPMFIENIFIHGFSTELRNAFAENLGLIGEVGLEKCARYALDESSVQGQRDGLIRQLEILVNATRILDRF